MRWAKQKFGCYRLFGNLAKWNPCTFSVFRKFVQKGQRWKFFWCQRFFESVELWRNRSLSPLHDSQRTPHWYCKVYKHVFCNLVPYVHLTLWRFPTHLGFSCHILWAGKQMRYCLVQGKPFEFEERELFVTQKSFIPAKQLFLTKLLFKAANTRKTSTHVLSDTLQGMKSKLTGCLYPLYFH